MPHTFQWFLQKCLLFRQKRLFLTRQTKKINHTVVVGHNAVYSNYSLIFSATNHIHNYRPDSFL